MLPLSGDGGKETGLEVLHLPGHTPDSIALYLRPEGRLFAGPMHTKPPLAHPAPSPSHTLPPLPRTPCPRRTPCPLHALRPLPCLHCQPADCARGPLPVSCFRPTAATDCRGLAVPARLHLPQPPRHFQPMHGTAILYRPLLSARSARICLTAHQLAATVNTVPPPASQALPRLISRIQLTG